MSSTVLNVEKIVEEIRREAAAGRRARLSRPGGSSAYADLDTYEAVEGLLRRADDRDRSLLLLPELFAGRDELTLETAPRISSHRKLLGPVLVAVKRRLLVPLNRWILDYTSSNFRRQQQVNLLLSACIEELAIEVARLRRQLPAE